MKSSDRAGKILKTLFFFLIIMSLVAAGAYAGWMRMRNTVKVDPPQMVVVKKDTFIHEILERGSVDSASNVEIRCQVESAGGLTIISVIPEGAVVKKGDLLVELDSSTLRENVTKQQIAVLASQSKLAESEAALKKAELTLKEYKEGKYQEELKTIMNEKFSADEEVKKKEDSIRFYKRLLERDYVTQSKVNTDLIDLEKAKLAFEIAELKMKVLNEYTYPKNIVQYEADIASAQAKVESDKKSHELDKQRLDHLESQLSLCRIVAPQDGQVIYYMTRWGGEEDLIKEGKKVYERQILLRLPDISQMQVKGLVNEANIRLVKVGQTATVRLEAFPNQVFNGVVRVVNDYPEPAHWMGGSMSKEYMTTIQILDSPEGIKPGLTAEAKITVNEITDALVLPVQAVFEHGGKTFALTFKDGKWDKIEIKTGPSNDKEVVILEGLKEGDEVVLGAWAHRDNVDLPKLKLEEENVDAGLGEPKSLEAAGSGDKTQPPKESGGERRRSQSGEKKAETPKLEAPVPSESKPEAPKRETTKSETKLEEIPPAKVAE